METIQSSTKEMLKDKFEIDGPFVKVMQLSAVLGVDSSTIYRAIRAGRFMIPHHLILSSPVVKLDDFVAWYDQGANVSMAKVNDELENKPTTVVSKDKVTYQTLSERIATEAQSVYGRDLVAAMCEKLGMQHKSGKVASRMR